MARIKIEDLSTQGQDLSAEEMGKVVGGRITYRHWTQRRVRYRTVTRRVRVRVLQTRRNVTARGTNYGRWRTSGGGRW